MTAYTKEMLDSMVKAAPLNLEIAKGFSATFSDQTKSKISVQSVIAKAKAEGIEYIAKAPAAKRAKVGLKRN